MAPELMAGEKATQAADVYSFGVLMYELANNADALPFAALSNVAVIEMVQCGRRLDVSEFAPPVVQELINQCTAMNRQQRPTFRWLARHFRTLASQELASAQPSADNHNTRLATASWKGKNMAAPALPNLNISHEDTQPLLLRGGATNDSDDSDDGGDAPSSPTVDVAAFPRDRGASGSPQLYADAQSALKELGGDGNHHGGHHGEYVPMETLSSSSAARGRDNSTTI
jgi:serine/threonine protein kinase